jgi:hypothetical protein
MDQGRYSRCPEPVGCLGWRQRSRVVIALHAINRDDIGVMPERPLAAGVISEGSQLEPREPVLAGRAPGDNVGRLGSERDPVALGGPCLSIRKGRDNDCPVQRIMVF